MSGGVNEYRLICLDLMIWADIFSEACNRCTDALMLLMLLLLIKCKLASILMGQPDHLNFAQLYNVQLEFEVETSCCNVSI